MTIVCPECKNEIDLSGYTSLEIGSVIECNMCGITLQVIEKEGNNVEVEIIDEGK